jgi:hypothetical protein
LKDLRGFSLRRTARPLGGSHAFCKRLIIRVNPRNQRFLIPFSAKLMASKCRVIPSPQVGQTARGSPLQNRWHSAGFHSMRANHWNPRLDHSPLPGGCPDGRMANIHDEATRGNRPKSGASSFMKKPAFSPCADR